MPPRLFALVRALELGRLCSNDPVCASHSPARDQAERHLEGAACHGCLYLAEAATFITSANFTAAAQTRNVEVGVLVRDADFAARVGSQWRSLVARGLFRRMSA